MTISINNQINTSTLNSIKETTDQFNAGKTNNKSVFGNIVGALKYVTSKVSEKVMEAMNKLGNASANFFNFSKNFIGAASVKNSSINNRNKVEIYTPEIIEPYSQRTSDQNGDIHTSFVLPGHEMLMYVGINLEKSNELIPITYSDENGDLHKKIYHPKENQFKNVKSDISDSGKLRPYSYSDENGKVHKGFLKPGQEIRIRF